LSAINNEDIYLKDYADGHEAKAGIGEAPGTRPERFAGSHRLRPSFRFRRWTETVIQYR
jgi:hypothetical protein